MRDEKIKVLFNLINCAPPPKRSLIEDLTTSPRDALIHELVRRTWKDLSHTDRLRLAELIGIPISRCLSIECAMTRIALKHREKFFRFDATSKHYKIRETLSLIEGWCDGLVPMERINQWRKERSNDFYKDDETMTLLSLVERSTWCAENRCVGTARYLKAFDDLRKCLEYSDHEKACIDDALTAFDKLLPWPVILAELER